MPRIRILLKYPLLPILAGLLLILQFAFSSRAWLVLLFGVGGIWLISLLWARTLGRSLNLQREMRFGWTQVGDRLQEHFTLTNNGIFPALWAEVLDQSTLPDYQSSRVISIGMLASEHWTTSNICTRRGLYILGPTTLRTGDPFGLYEVVFEYHESTVLLVLPPVVPLPAIQVAPGGRTGEGRRLRRDALERSVSSMGVREYQPGESTRWIHWPTSARRDTLFLRTFDSTPSSDWWILLDVDQAVQIGEAPNSTEEHAVILAASMADQGLRAGHAVGLISHGRELVWISPNDSIEQRYRVLRALAEVVPGPVALDSLLNTARPALRRGASLIIITPNPDPQWLANLLTSAHTGVMPTILLLDPASFGGEANIIPIQGLLANLGFAHYPITRAILDRPDIHPGKQGQWEWRVYGSRAVAVQKPGDLTWRRLN